MTDKDALCERRHMVRGESAGQDFFSFLPFCCFPACKSSGGSGLSAGIWPQPLPAHWSDRKTRYSWPTFQQHCLCACVCVCAHVLCSFASENEYIHAQLFPACTPYCQPGRRAEADADHSLIHIRGCGISLCERSDL